MTPAEFLASHGVNDWAVTGWGPQAVFTADSLAHAAELIPAIVDAAGRLALSPDVDLRAEAIVVSVPCDDLDALSPATADLAAAISTAARELGLRADPSRIQSVNISVADHAGDGSRAFWAAALGYGLRGDTDAIDPLRRGPELSFQPHAVEGRGRTHIDVFVPAAVAQRRVDAALAAGGRIANDTYAPQFWSLASPDNHGIDIAAWPDAR